MCIKLCVLGSGSKGNCIYVGCNKTHILVDLGLPIKRVEKCLAVLGVDPRATSVLITHEHSDHIKNLDSFVKKYGVNVYASSFSEPGISRSCDLSAGNYVFFEDEDFFVGEMTVTPFKVSHDVPCVGYTISAMGKRASIATDVGKVTSAVLKSIMGSDLVVLESNHDCELLKHNQKYSAALKARIMSTHGHLSNEDCAATLCSLVAGGTKQVVLAHLSEENNCPELAFETAKRVLSERGYVEGRDVKIEVAEQNKISALFEIS